MTEQLKPCAHCGSDNVDAEFWMADDDRTGPGCMNCGASGETIEKWNTRAVDWIPIKSNLLDPDMPTQELRLHMGELTNDEVMVARAAIRWANSKMEESK